MDIPTRQRISLLHPSLRDEMTEIINKINKTLKSGAEVRIIQGLRGKDDQNLLYSYGRTKPGPRITNIQFGQSYYNFGLAVDIALLVDGKVINWDLKSSWDNDKVTDWMECVDIFDSYGWKWGGNWKSLKDYSHFEKTFDYACNDLLIKYNKRDFIKGTKYVNI